MEKAFQVSVAIHGRQARECEIVVDTTVQGKNITFPADTKPGLKVIAKCWKIAGRENIRLRRGYRRELRELTRVIRFHRNRGAKTGNAAFRRVETIANALLGELGRRLSAEARVALAADPEIHTRAVGQKRNDRNRIYSPHGPEVLRIGKG